MWKQALGFFVLCGIVTSCAWGYSGGVGTPEDPYQIAKAQDLISLGNDPNAYDKCFILTSDIDFGRTRFGRAVIAWDLNDDYAGFQGPIFVGTFNGNHHTIRNLYIPNGAHCLGLFGRLGSTAVVSHLKLENVSIRGSGDYIGGLAGRLDGTLLDCSVTGTIRGRDWVGGLVGQSYSGNTMYCHSLADVSGNDTVGGLIGHMIEATASSCHSCGTITGAMSIGGLIGTVANSNVCNCYSTGAVSGNEHVGGFVGHNWFSSLVDSYTRSEIVYSDPNAGIGGFLGFSDRNSAVIVGSFWDTSISKIAQSAGGMGLLTEDMNQIDTYLDAQWDFADETDNGLSSFWQMDANDAFPTLVSWEDLPYPELTGDGSMVNPYMIYDVNELSAINAQPCSCYQLGADLDLAPMTLNTALIPVFLGHFDGDGHVIEHLTLDGAGHLGLFGQLSQGARVLNLGLAGVSIEGRQQHVGTIAGFSWASDIENCYAAGLVAGQLRTGGLCGTLSNSTVQYCFNSADVLAHYATGGIAGAVSASQVSNCCNLGSVAGDPRVGGLIGECADGADVRHCYSTGLVTGSDLAGGLIGYMDLPETVVSSFWDIESSGFLASAGGTGLGATQMQARDTFLDAGWDFDGETDNGTDDIWWIDEGQDYPRLWWELDVP